MFCSDNLVNFDKFCDTAPLILIQMVITAILCNLFSYKKSVYIVILRECVECVMLNPSSTNAFHKQVPDKV